MEIQTKNEYHYTSSSDLPVKSVIKVYFCQKDLWNSKIQIEHKILFTSDIFLRIIETDDDNIHLPQKQISWLILPEDPRFEAVIHMLGQN